MRKVMLALACFLLLDINGPWIPRRTEAASIPGEPGAAEEPAVSRAVQDYRSVRKVALALVVVGFMIALARLGMSEFPAERSRAQTLASLMAVIFVLLAGDRMIVRGVAEWFNLPTSSLPPFWR